MFANKFGRTYCYRAVRSPRKISPPLKPNFPTKNKIPEAEFANKGRTCQPEKVMRAKLWQKSKPRS